eukprot:13236655-Alexandrium_andersonii.AAC.1
MTSKEPREGGEAALRLAQGGSAVFQSADHDTWLSSVKVGEDSLHYFNTPGGACGMTGATRSSPSSERTRTCVPRSSRWLTPP